MEFRLLETGEHWKTRALWEEVFGEDTASFLDYYYEVKASDNVIYIAQNEERDICSMLQLNPYMLHVGSEEFCCSYIIAVATKEYYRKRGLMRELLYISLKAMYQRGEILTFLMPAAEAIYRPFDFRFVYDQRQGMICGKNSDNGRYTVRRAGADDCAAMAEFAAAELSSYQVYAKRNKAYYSVMLKEQESEQGGCLLVYAGDDLVGFFAYAEEAEYIIREPLFREGHDEAFLHAVYQLTGDESKEVKCYGIGAAADKVECKPNIMFRILHPESVFEVMVTRRALNLTLRISDPIIAENNCCLHLSGEAGSHVRTEKQHIEQDNDTISIAALTSLLFGYKGAAEITAEEGVDLSPDAVIQLEAIKPLDKIFLNEVV